MSNTPTGTIRVPAFFAISALLLITATTMAQWSAVGPTGGGIAGIVADPADPDVAYAKDAGLNRTVDGGATWTPLPLDIHVSDLAFDPNAPHTIYATGFGAIGVKGVFKSTNRGDDWTQLTLPATALTRSVMSVAAGSTPGLLLAGLDRLGGVLRSTDGGATWTTNTLPVANFGFFPNVKQIAFQPGNPSVVYALLANQFGDQGAVIRSNDDGATSGVLPGNITVTASHIFLTSPWYVTRSGDGGFTATTLASFAGLRQLVADAAGARIWLASTDGVRASTDSGATWTLTPTAPLTGLALASNGTTLYASTVESGVLRSTDAGVSWAATTGIYALFPWDIAVDSTHSGTIYAATMDEGVKKSTDGGATWSTANVGLQMACASQIEIDPLNPSTLYVVSIGGVYKSTDAAASWTLIWTAPSNYSIMVLAADPDHSGSVLASTSWGLYRTTDGGDTWTHVGAPSIFAQAIAFAGGGSSVVYAGGGSKVWKSVDNGLVWIDQPTGFPSSYTDPSDLQTYPFIVYALGVDPNNPNIVYAGTNGPGVFKTTNGGQTWSEINNGLVTKDVRAFAFDTGNSAIVYLSTEGFGGVWRSADGGGHWARFSAGLTIPATKVVFPLVADTAPPFTLYGGTFGGVIKYAFASPEAATQPASVAGIEGGQLSASGSFIDADGDPIQISASAGLTHDNGDGSWTWTVTPADDVLAQNVVVTATDSHGAVATESFTYTAINAVPVLSPLSIVPSGCGVAVAFTFADAGAHDTHTTTIAWGDGTSTIAGESPVTASHVYVDGLSSHTISASVADDDGGVSVAGTVTAVSANQASEFMPPIRNGDTYNAGRVLPLKLDVTSCSGEVVLGLSPQVTMTRLGAGGGPVAVATAAHSGDRMRLAGEKYVFELSTKGLAAGEYRIAVVDASFSSPAEVTIVLR